MGSGVSSAGAPTVQAETIEAIPSQGCPMHQPQPTKVFIPSGCPMHQTQPFKEAPITSAEAGPAHQDRAYEFVECPMRAAEARKSDIDPANMVYTVTRENSRGWEQLWRRLCHIRSGVWF
ncbi:hypothetical protein ILYODFUR_027756 [Ilyodon furcidens]|uniref:Uncharacterized protein n=1 Tax=Ilyodon furcidens TaxID=33524 RepID=A0ABV0VIQ0_9TELE